MSTYTIGEVAERTGFTASALRYYEGIGLLSASTRSAAGYRLYDDDALARLAFVARAKQLGCSLEEIADLASAWDGERCGPVQRRLHDLVTSKIDAATAQLAELTAFTAQLQRAAAQLGTEPADGPCDGGCACMTAAAPAPAASETVAIACTLDPGEMPDRMGEWRALLARAHGRSRTADGALRVELALVDLDDTARLVAAEQQCCAFFSFAITVDGRGVGLEVHAPADADDVVAALFGTAGPPRPAVL